MQSVRLRSYCLLGMFALTMLHPSSAFAEAEGVDPNSAFEQMVAMGLAQTLCNVDVRGTEQDMQTMMRNARRETGLSEKALIERITLRVIEDEDAHRNGGTEKMFCEEMRRLAGGSTPSSHSVAFEKLVAAGYTARKSAPAKDRNLKALLSSWQKENEVCRGTSDDRTMPACDRRDEVSQQLSLVGWCYGKKGQAGYQMEWHACGRGSNRG